jgi:hypothetical protein
VPALQCGPLLLDGCSAIPRANAAKKATENTEAKVSATTRAAFPSGCPVQMSEIGNVTIVSARKTIIAAPRIVVTSWREINLFRR